MRCRPRVWHPTTTYAWQLVATSRYLTDDPDGALEAWNQIGEPRVDTIAIHGAERTPHPIIVGATKLAPRQVLTPEAFERASRELGNLPAVSAAHLRYEPLDSGRASVDVSIDERPVVPTGWIALATLGARALLFDEARVDATDLLSSGEVASVSGRWSAPRPRVDVGLALPSRHGLPGILSFDASWEQQSYGQTPDGATFIREGRRRTGLSLADWPAGWLRWQIGGALDRLREYDDADENRFGARDYLALESAVDVRLAADRVAISLSGGWWTPFAGGDRFGTVGLLVAWRSTVDATRPSFSAIAEGGSASHAAPLALWSGAGTGHGRSWLLRAHPLLTDDVVTGPVFGRDAVHGSFEYARPVGHAFAGALSVAGFVDAAAARQRLSGLGPSPLYVDTGVGLRVRAPGSGSQVRVDLAHGLRGGGVTLSAGWDTAWPR